MKCKKCDNDLTQRELEARASVKQIGDYVVIDGVEYTGYSGGCLCFDEELRKRRYGMPKPDICECNPICLKCQNDIYKSHTARIIDGDV